MLGNIDWLSVLAALPSPTGPGVGAALIYVLVHAAQAVSAWKKSVQAGTSAQGASATSKAIDQTVIDAVMQLLAQKPAQPAAPGQVPDLTPDDMGKAVSAVRLALDELHGVKLDSDVIRGKVQAFLGQLRLPFPVPGPPKTA